MCLEEEVDGFTFMPAGSIHIKPDRISPKSSVEMGQDLPKTLPISSFCPNHPETSQKRCHPSRQVKTLLVLARRRDAKRKASLDPAPSQSGMQAKPRLILKNHRLPWPQILKFFLTPGETASLLPPGLEDTNNRLVLNDIPVGASISEPAGLSSSIHTDVLGVRRGWDRPIEPGLAQNLGATFPNAAPPPGRSGALIVTAALGSACSSGLSSRPNLPPGSNDSSSSGLSQERGPSIQGVALPLSKEAPQSSTPAKRREGPWQKLPGFPGSPPDFEYRLAPYRHINIDRTNL